MQNHQPPQPVGTPISAREIHSGCYIPPEVLNDPKLSPAAKLVYGRLRWHARDKSSCWPAVATLSEALGMNSSTIHRALKTLKDQGYIMISGAKFRNSTYTFLLHRRFLKAPSDMQGAQHGGYPAQITQPVYFNTTVNLPPNTQNQTFEGDL